LKKLTPGEITLVAAGMSLAVERLVVLEVSPVWRAETAGI